MSDPEHAWRTAFRHPGRWDEPFPPLSMVELFEASAAAHPEAPLLDFMGRRYSYGETLDGVRRAIETVAADGLDRASLARRLPAGAARMRLTVRCGTTRPSVPAPARRASPASARWRR